MSTTLSTPQRAQNSSWRDDWRGWLPTVLVAVALAAMWVVIAIQYDTPETAVVKYALYFAGCVTFPGTLVWKAVFGTRSWAADLTWGSILGICLELVAWAGFSLLGLQSILIVWPLLTLPVLLNRAARRKVLQLPPAPKFSLGVGLVAFAILSLLLRVWWLTVASVDLPPTSQPYYVDILWHMGLANEATRAFPLLTPQLIDAGLLKYSWFVHAQIGAGSLITGLDVPIIMLRLWQAPMIVLGVSATALLARELTGKAWAGGIAALLVASQGSFRLWREFLGASNIFPLNSPTQTYSIAISVLCVKLIIDAFRDGLRWPGWLLLVLSGIVCSGSKSSIMLMVTAAVCGTVVVSAFLGKFRPRMIGIAGLFVGLTLFAMAFVTGGGGGSSVQILSSFTLLPPFRKVGGDPAFNELFADDLISSAGLGYWLLIVLFVVMALRMLLALVVLVIPFIKELRQDLAAWVLGGAVLSAWVPFLLLSHRGYSQYYFMHGAVPFAAVLGAWWLSTALPSSRAGRWVTIATGSIMAAGTAISSIFVFNPPAWDKSAMVSFLAQTSVFFGIVAVLGITAFVTRRRAPGLFSGAWVAAFLAPLLITPLIALPWHGASEPKPPSEGLAAVKLAETQAGMWVNENVDTHDVMATNAACSATYSTTCDARRWWLSGLGGRRVFLDGWRYVPEGADGEISEFDAQALNEAAFQNPSDETIGALRDRGVSWMVVESLPGFPAPDLSAWGDVEYSNDLVTVYRLR